MYEYVRLKLVLAITSMPSSYEDGGRPAGMTPAQLCVIAEWLMTPMKPTEPFGHGFALCARREDAPERLRALILTLNDTDDLAARTRELRRGGFCDR